MKRAIPLVLSLCGVAAACEQAEQALPFETAGQEVSRVVSASGGTVGTPAGATVTFPEGALESATTVTVAVEAPPAALRAGGTPLGASAFRVEPAGTRLGRPARAELRFDPAAAGSRAWLATVVAVTPSGVRVAADTRVDLSTGIAQAGVSTLGTLAVVLPDPAAVVHVRPAARLALSPAPAASASGAAVSGVDSVVVRCGDSENRCTGLVVEASENLVGRVEDAAAVYPRIEGVLRVSGSTAGGRIDMSTAFRALLQSGQTAENLTIVALLEPTASTTVSETASEIVFTSVRHHVGGSAESGSATQETVARLAIPFSGSTGTVTIVRTFEMRNDAGALEPAWVRLAFPVQIYR